MLDKADAIFNAACGFSVTINVISFIVFSDFSSFGSALGLLFLLLDVFAFSGSSCSWIFPGLYIVVRSSILGFAFTGFSTVIFDSEGVRNASTAI